MLDFSQQPEERDNDLIPTGQLAFAIMKVREIKTSPTTGTRYLDCEFTIDEGQPYAKRKLWTNIMDPLCAQNSEGAKNIGLVFLRRALEVAFGASPDNPQSYVNAISDYSQLNGIRIPIKISIKKEKPDSAYEDKNELEFLSPHSSSKSVVKSYNALVHEGKYNIKTEDPAPAGAQAGFGMGGPPVAGTPPAAPATPPTAPAGPPVGQPNGTPPMPPQQGVPPTPPQQAAQPEDEIPF